MDFKNNNKKAGEKLLCGAIYMVSNKVTPHFYVGSVMKKQDMTIEESVQERFK
jgi:hypothetical protein